MLMGESLRRSRAHVSQEGMANDCVTAAGIHPPFCHARMVLADIHSSLCHARMVLAGIHSVTVAAASDMDSR